MPSLAIHRYDVAAAAWVKMVAGTDPCVANGITGTCVWIEVNHLNTFALVGTKTTAPSISAADADGDGVPDVWDVDNSTPSGYWVNSDGIGRRWGDMNGDGELTSVDALMILQAAVGNIELIPTENVTLRPPKPIYLDDYAFTPKNPTIRMGEALNWINLQKSPMINYVLVSEDGLWENQTISYGKKFKYTFNTSGSYTYYCPGYGSAMRGTVTVLE